MQMNSHAVIRHVCLPVVLAFALTLGACDHHDVSVYDPRVDGVAPAPARNE